MTQAPTRSFGRSTWQSGHVLNRGVPHSSTRALEVVDAAHTDENTTAHEAPGNSAGMTPHTTPPVDGGHRWSLPGPSSAGAAVTPSSPAIRGISGTTTTTDCNLIAAGRRRGA
jgi:hypothetical protein